MTKAGLVRALEVRGLKSIYAATVSRWESGEQEPKLSEAVALADALGLSLDSLANPGADTQKNRRARVDRASAATDIAERESIEAIIRMVRSADRLREALDGLEPDDLHPAERGIHERSAEWAASFVELMDRERSTNHFLGRVAVAIDELRDDGEG